MIFPTIALIRSFRLLLFVNIGLINALKSFAVSRLFFLALISSRRFVIIALARYVFGGLGRLLLLLLLVLVAGVLSRGVFSLRSVLVLLLIVRVRLYSFISDASVLNGVEEIPVVL